jgi:hypothetical protein
VVKDKQSYSIELEPEKTQFLEEVARRHGLPDISKAVRCLINYARENPEQQQAIFAEIRCMDC